MFGRESAKKKIGVLLEKVGAGHRLLTSVPAELEKTAIDYKKVHEVLQKERMRSIELLERAIKNAEELYA